MYGGLEFFYKNKLGKLKGCLCAETLDLKDILKQIDELTKYKNIEKYSYFNSLLYPEKVRGCKIPSQVSASSCSFQLRNTLDLIIPSRGYFMGIFNPFFLANSENEGKKIEEVYTDGFYDGFYIGDKLTSFWKNNGDAFNDTTWYPYYLNQVIPSVYNQYRLVSASLKIKYIGALKENSGTIGCGIWTRPFSYIGGFIQPVYRDAPYSPSGGFAPTGGFFGDLTIDAIRHCMYFTENPLLEGIRALYFPLDNSYLEYTKLCDRSSFNINYFNDRIAFQGKRVCLSMDKSVYKNGFNWVFFVEGGPREKRCLRMETICNFECFPSEEALQYMPITNEGIFDLHEDLNLAITSVRNKPISSYC